MANGNTPPRPPVRLPPAAVDEPDAALPAAPMRPAVVRPPLPPSRRALVSPSATAAATARRRLTPRR
jgi:hypothetical protein